MLRNLLTLALQGTLRKKRSSVLIFSVLLISFSFAIVALSLVGSISKTNAEFRLNAYGEWYYAIPSGKEADGNWVQNQPWIESAGTAVNYATIGTQSGVIAFGTVDQALIDLGRIRIEAGKFPTEDHEIALEADALSALGYDYTLGQEITVWLKFPYKDKEITIQRSYTLCGVIGEYSNLWVLNRNPDQRLLVSAIVTPNAAESALAEVKQCISIPENRDLVVPAWQYFLEVSEDNRADARNALGAYLGLHQVSENTAAYPGGEAVEYDDVYIYMVAAVTMIAVLCVYMLQMPAEIRSFSILRSIGITKRQMALLLIAETLILSLPAAALGIPCGAALTRLGLRLMLYSGSVDIQVSIPYDALAAVIGLWVAAVLAARFIMFVVTVHIPTTGRLAQGKQRRIHALRSALILVLVSAFGAVTIYTGMESLNPAHDRTYWSLCPAYTIWEDHTVSVAKTDLICQVPGVQRIDGFGEMSVGLSFDGSDEQTVWLYAIDETGWKESLNFKGIEEAFRNGNTVLLCFPEESEEDYILPQGEVMLRVYRSDGTILTQKQTAVTIAKIPEDAYNRALYAFYEPYTIFCSERFLQEILSSMEPGEIWDKYIAGEEFGYDRVYVGVDLNSDYLSTDIAIADLCKELGLTFDNRRQEFGARVQENVQTLILLYSSGLCIGLVVLLILSSTLVLEAEQEQFRYRILRSIGMSMRQMCRRIFAKALLRSLAAVTVGWGVYILLGTEKDWNPEAVLILSSISLMVPLVVSLLSKRSLMKGKMVL